MQRFSASIRWLTRPPGEDLDREKLRVQREAADPLPVRGVVAAVRTDRQLRARGRGGNGAHGEFATGRVLAGPDKRPYVGLPHAVKNAAFLQAGRRS